MHGAVVAGSEEAEANGEAPDGGLRKKETAAGAAADLIGSLLETKISLCAINCQEYMEKPTEKLILTANQQAITDRFS